MSEDLLKQFEDLAIKCGVEALKKAKELISGLETKNDHLLKEVERLRRLESEYDAVFYLAVRKWFDEEPSDRVRAAGDAREIALRAIEQEAMKKEKAIHLLEEVIDTFGSAPEKHSLMRKIRQFLDDVQNKEQGNA